MGLDRTRATAARISWRLRSPGRPAPCLHERRDGNPVPLSLVPAEVAAHPGDRPVDGRHGGRVQHRYPARVEADENQLTAVRPNLVGLMHEVPHAVGLGVRDGGQQPEERRAYTGRPARGLHEASDERLVSGRGSVELADGRPESRGSQLPTEPSPLTTLTDRVNGPDELA